MGVEIPENIHRFLERQIRKSMDAGGNLSFEKLISLIDEFYHQVDEEQLIAHQSIIAMSKELNEANEDLHKHAQILKESEERYVLATLGANDGLWDWDILHNKCFFSERWLEILGYSDGDAFKDIDSWIDHIHLQHQKNVASALHKHVEGDTERFEAEYQIKTQAGDYKWVLSRGIAARDESGKAIRVAGSQTDISQRKKYEDQLFKAAFHDKLTGLPNRSLFMDRLKHLLKQYKRTGHKQKAGLLFLDLDRFKIINDSLGHEAGDQLLVSVAGRLEINLRPGDSICRLGGDEFTILLHEIDNQEHAKDIADRILKEIKKPYFLLSQQIFISGSIGIVIIDKHQDPETVLRHADLAMYQAKNNGKSCFEIFKEAKNDDMYITLQIDTDLRSAIENEELFLLYQPIVNLSTGHVEGLEALVRWEHPRKGIIPPIQFIPLAEETGMILPIGEYVIQKVCEQVKNWAKTFSKLQHPPTITVNLSSKQITNLNHFKKLVRICSGAKLAEGLITFELTESSLVENIHEISSRLALLKKANIKLAIDDFGTGYSSLNYLTTLPFHYIKIDKSFVSEILSNDKKKSIVKSIISLSQDLNMKTVAEGIETEDVHNYLQHLGCDYGQGYFYAKPLTSDEALDFIVARTKEGPTKKKETVSYHREAYF